MSPCGRVSECALRQNDVSPLFFFAGCVFLFLFLSLSLSFFISLSLSSHSFSLCPLYLFSLHLSVVALSLCTVLSLSSFPHSWVFYCAYTHWSFQRRADLRDPGHVNGIDWLCGDLLCHWVSRLHAACCRRQRPCC